MGTGVYVGVGSGVLVTVGTGVYVGVGAGVDIPRAFAAFSLPPVATFPDNAGIISTDPRILLFICAVVNEGFNVLSRAAVPVT